jgi:FkbM family methyltransferase
MANGIEFGKILVRRVARFPAIGYPLLLAWQKGWVPTSKGTVEVHLRDGRTLRCKLSDRTQRTMALGVFEPGESRLIEEVLRPRNTFIDVGAHIGWFTTIASRCVGQDGLVIACEPYPANVATLKENLTLNDAQNVQLVEKALGSRPGVLSLSGSDSGGITALDWPHGGRVEVSMTTLDQVAVDVENVTLMKIDVEGWEAHVLNGGTETLARTQHVLFEINQFVLNKAGSSSEEIYNLLRNSGFKTFVPVGQYGLRRLHRNRDVTNILASR